MSPQSKQIEDKPRPWTDDDRLNDPFILGTFNTVINLIQEFATLAENLPEGRIPKTQSIPVMWETVKDLKPESLKKEQWKRSIPRKARK